jgi:predicted nucleic-acid-binding protein
MPALDTNVLVRYLTKDDETQWQKATEIIESDEVCFISNIVLCELVWVLEGRRYKFAKNEILLILKMMLNTATFEFESRSVFYQAIQAWEQGSADFSDYLITRVAVSQGYSELMTFDQKLRDAANVRLL